jgi:hypothetical protein
VSWQEKAIWALCAVLLVVVTVARDWALSYGDNGAGGE